MRHPEIPQGIFKPKPTAIETKQDATTRAARQIVNGEAAAREQKTERLRLARLARQQIYPRRRRRSERTGVSTAKLYQRNDPGTLGRAVCRGKVLEIFATKAAQSAHLPSR
ncbi:MAG: hypothetical protein EOQ64_04970 [Mesorhizobium sp.]|nr:MAG: hypothetical protein EOQ64_04970 [Mesorhizobium sp.]RWH45707.1 MAG: hypothetical protein EOQ78_05915 [Mesorhizobium sp.]RWI26203.1 MAG: hypothetical protein EOQ94_11690 [Mesorhizobium sp.]TIO03973.1 MAG: hypothetical protein E5X93_31320 [Mesorhizobium sp.]